MNLSKLVIAFFVSLSLFTTTMSAEVISTKQLMHESASNANIDNFLQKQEVQEKLAMLGVSSENMQERIASLTDEEISQINQQIESLPAGGSTILGVLVFIVVVLLITDILGYTKVFNFTRSVQ
jgi:hypothetical protein